MSPTPKFRACEKDPDDLSATERNPVFSYQQYKDFLDHCLGEIQLATATNLTPTTLKPDMLYVAERTWTNDNGSRKEKAKQFAYEEYLDLLFWNETSNKKVTFLTGAVGCGKTTLLNFYLHFYCPYISSNRERFKEKLVIYVNMKGKRTDESFLRTLGNAMKKAIMERCQAVKYPIEKFVGESHEHSDASQWAERAVEHVQARRDDGATELPFKYLVIALDNLDQSSVTVQNRAIQEVNDWVSQRTCVRPYRIYVSFWPKTLDALLKRLGDPIPRNYYERIDVGRLDAGGLSEKRANSLANSITETRVTSTPFPPLTASVHSFLAEQENHRSARFVRDAWSSFNSVAMDRLVSLTNGNLRAIFQCFGNLLLCKRAFDTWERVTSKGKPGAGALSSYEIFDACLTGDKRVFDSPESSIPNFYNLSCTSPLLGIHLLSILELQAQVPESRVINGMITLGHPEFAITEALRAFDDSEYQPWYPIAAGYEQQDFVVSQKSVKAMLDFAFDPVYIDHCAMVTPVPMEYMANMAVTLSSDRDQFFSRVETTLAFIDYISQEESEMLLRFFSVSSNKTRDAKAYESLRSVLVYQVRLPMIASRMRMSYLKRIKSLRDGMYLSGAKKVSAGWWESVIERLSQGIGGLTEDSAVWRTDALLR